ncbi:MAG: TIGR03960 family B12-binding radical SAM protein [Thermodesulfobacteriota bacterium]
MSLVTDRLERLDRPSRYLGGEVGAVIKDEAAVRLRIALAFPDVYEIGMSHVGLKILYGLINGRPDFWAERVMAPWLDLEEDLRAKGQRLASLESGRPLGEFDLIGFSLQYELSYTNVLNMLDLAGLPLLARERGAGRPLIVGGGPNAGNPEPLADFFDFFFLGDAEAGFLEVLDEIAAWKEAGGSKPELLSALAGRPGIYVPAFFEPIYDRAGRLVLVEPKKAGYETAARAVCPDLDAAYFPDRPIVPFTKPVHDRVAFEIARGCTRGCRFCQAGFIYRPVRERRPETILDLATRTLASTGLDEASFLSLSAGDYTCLTELLAAFMDVHGSRHVAMSLPSLRVKSLTPEMMRQIKRVRKTGFTLAPEAGTQRLREVINKDLTEEDLTRTARTAFSLGWRLIKLYFMIGLPTETEADVLAIADLARRVQAGARAQVNVSFAAFVPKAHTPFQWEPMLTPEEIRTRMDLLRGRLKRPKLKPKWNPAESSLIEGLLARGDRRLGPVIRSVQARGGRFDSWNDLLRLDLWRAGLAKAGLNPDDYLRGRPRSETLPWGHLKCGPDLDYLWAERERAYQGRTTADCRDGACAGCGMCDFQEVRPRLCPEGPFREPVMSPLSLPESSDRYLINYAKEGRVRLLSHLETVEVFTRAFRRAGLDFKMSQGFHPQPRLSFATALPVGLASRDEYLQSEILGSPEEAAVADLLIRELPAGFRVKGVRRLDPEEPRIRVKGSRYRLEVDRERFDPLALEAALAADNIWVDKKTKSGIEPRNLKLWLGPVKVLTPKEIELTLFQDQTGSIKPLAAAKALFDLTPEILAEIRLVKLETLLA